MNDQIFKRFQDFLHKSQNIIISTHEGPDADGIGSQIALCLALQKLGKNVVCVNDLPLPDRYLYLDQNKCVLSYLEYQEYRECRTREKTKERSKGKTKTKTKTRTTTKAKFDLPAQVDLFIGVDTNTPSRLAPPIQELLKASKNFVFIDHHPCPSATSAIHCIDTLASATGELVGRLILRMGLDLTPEMALALYTSILIDTSSFRYPTVSAQTHRLLAAILDSGVRPAEAYNKIYGTKKLNHLKLLGIILSQVQMCEEEGIAWMVITQDIMEEFQSNNEDTHSFINHLLILENIKVACMFRQIDNKVRIGLRSTGSIDVGELAEALGGGGHNHSAATLIEGALDQVIPETIEKLKIMLKSINP